MVLLFILHAPLHKQMHPKCDMKSKNSKSRRNNIDKQHYLMQWRGNFVQAGGNRLHGCYFSVFNIDILTINSYLRRKFG